MATVTAIPTARKAGTAPDWSAQTTTQPIDLMDGHELTTNSPESDAAGRVRWGFISAKPSEFLIVYRRGRLRERVSGQGSRCFKLPGDTVAIVPTTLKEVIFKANQITADNVDVRLRGVVVYRIRDPLRIYKLINFTNRSHAEAKLARMIADMCRSTAKWLVANLGVQECIRRRKEEIAAALKHEVSAVVSSSEEAGWGVEIVTIDIQDIYIQDAELFTSLQARFKSEKQREARLAELESQREVERRTIEVQSQIAADKHAQAMAQAERTAHQKLAEVELQRTQDEARFALELYRAEQTDARARIEVEQELARQALATDADLALKARESEAHLALQARESEAHLALQARETEAQLDRQARETEAQLKRQALEAEAQRARSRLQTDAWREQAEEETRQHRARIDAENAAGPAALQRTFIEKALPAVAASVAASLSNVRMHVVQTGGPDAAGALGPFQLVMQSVMEVVEQFVAQQRQGRGE